MRRAPGASRASAGRPPKAALDRLVAELADDAVREDVTTRALGTGRGRGRAVILAESAGVLSGSAAAVHVARSAGVRATPLLRDGARLRPGRPVLRITGQIRSILGIERTLLNVLMHLSGVATATDAAVRAVRHAGGAPAIYATRKTLPGLRDLEKAAVVHGGGFPHRRDLSDGFLLKTPHLALVPLPEAIRRVRSVAAGRPVEVEVRTFRDARAAVRAGAEAILLDNLAPARAARLIERLRAEGLRDGVWIELSGGITPSTAGRYARCGADALSLGAITHSAPALPFHLRWAASHGARPT